MSKTCSVEGCENNSRSLGLCEKHYYRLRRHGSTSIVFRRRGNQYIQEFPREYRIWKAMNNRCRNKNDWHYKYYGKKGINICERWSGVDGFTNFILDMGGCPVDFTLDRIDVNGDYCPENCRWADRDTQSKNRGQYKNGIYIKYNGETKSISAWCKELNLPSTCILRRWHKGIVDPDVLFSYKRKK